jgi:hypothetical protein
VTASVEIVAPFQIASYELAFIGAFVARQAARYRPDASGVQGFQQHGIGHQAGHAPVAVKKRVNPQQTVMGSRRRKNGAAFSQMTVACFKTFHKARHRPRANRDMTAYFYIALPELARNDFYALAGIRLFGP